MDTDAERYIAAVREFLHAKGLSDSDISEEYKKVDESKDDFGKYLDKLDPEKRKLAIHRFLYMKFVGEVTRK